MQIFKGVPLENDLAPISHASLMERDDYLFFNNGFEKFGEIYSGKI